MTRTLVERLRDPRYCGQESMRSEAADRIEELERENQAAIEAVFASKARIEKLEAALKWVGEVYPDTLPSRGARVEMTWDEFNTMREVMGLPLRKPKPRARASLIPSPLPQQP